MRFLVPLLGFVSCIIAAIAVCNRKPQGANGEPSPVDENFQILIEGNPATYIPGQQYNISLSCANGLKFIGFTLAVESEDGNSAGYDMLGHFELIDIAETRFSAQCANIIESTNTNIKTRVDVAWVAPTNPGSGCLLIRAAVLQHRNVWSIDDGFLTKRICPEEIDEVNSQTPPVDPCCVCDEAKYEIILERKWSRNTHAKHYPPEPWHTRFSELIGASHTIDYRFWEYGRLASRGLQEMAEHGATSTLETEIKANINNGSIRTIIKAPGITHRNSVYGTSLGTTLATARLDPIHHLISLVSKIVPSPDWVLGVAGLELCLANCTWVERKVLNLYPWDIGTDAGPSYESSDQPQIPPDVVRRITATFPSDYRSPFFDDKGAPMKPLGTLYVTRKKLYERDCDSSENLPLECATHPWNNWSECSSKCGTGTQYRVRFYKDVGLAASFNCQVVLTQSQSCAGSQCGSEASPSAAECELTMWSEWSPCSKRCGKGYITRTRDYVYPYARTKCQSGISMELQESRTCLGEDCGGTIRGEEIEQQLGNNGGPEWFEENQSNNNRPQLNQQLRPVYNADANPNMFENQYEPEINQNERQFSNSFNNVLNLNRQNAPIYSSIPKNEDVGSQGYIYGREKLTRHQDGFYEPESDNIFTNTSHAFNPSTGNTNYNRIGVSFDQQPHQLFTPNRNLLPNQVNSNMQGIYNTQPPYRRYHTPSNNGETIMVESVDPNNYDVVQEYCYEKPFASLKTCNTRKIIVNNYWFYDAEDRQCKLFTADNCDENKNKFRTLDACEGTCHKPLQNLEQLQESSTSAFGFQEPQSQTRSRGSTANNQRRKYSLGKFH